MKRQAAARLLARTGLRRLIGRATRWTGVLCLNYHRIGPVEGPDAPGLVSAMADAFDRQVAFFRRECDVVSPDEVPDAPGGARHRFLLITFDDGYRDNHRTAFPILARHGVPATFFVTTGYLDQPRLPWWDEIAWMVRSSRRTSLPAHDRLPGPIVFAGADRAAAVETLLDHYKRLPGAETSRFLDDLADATGSGRADRRLADGLWMNWDMVREMRDAGMVFGGHTVTHPVLANLSPSEQEAEIAGCARRLAEELGAPMRYFSYPVGQSDSFNGDTRAALQRAGVRMAFSYYGGYQRFGDWDRLDTRRASVEAYMDLAWVQAIATLPGLFSTH